MKLSRTTKESDYFLKRNKPANPSDGDCVLWYRHWISKHFLRQLSRPLSKTINSNHPEVLIFTLLLSKEPSGHQREHNSAMMSFLPTKLKCYSFPARFSLFIHSSSIYSHLFSGSKQLNKPHNTKRLWGLFRNALNRTTKVTNVQWGHTYTRMYHLESILYQSQFVPAAPRGLEGM